MFSFCYFPRPPEPPPVLPPPPPLCPPEPAFPPPIKRMLDKKLDNLFKIYQKKKGLENVNLTKKLSPSLVSFSNILENAISVS